MGSLSVQMVQMYDVLGFWLVTEWVAANFGQALSTLRMLRDLETNALELEQLISDGVVERRLGKFGLYRFGLCFFLHAGQGLLEHREQSFIKHLFVVDVLHDLNEVYFLEVFVQNIFGDHLFILIDQGSVQESIN